MDQLNIFRKALRDPLAVSEEEFRYLLSKYPYSQPIVFSYERKKQLEGNPVDKQKVLLYANNAFWALDYLNKPVPNIPEIEVEPEGYIAFEDLSDDNSYVQTEENSIEEDEEVLIVEEEMDHETSHQSYNQEETDSGFIEDEVEEKKSVDKASSEELENIFDPPLAYNIESEYPEEIEEESEEEFDDKTSEENISLYNDELMPYSFKWWLYKTRLEHADTYQPFLPPNLPKAQKGQFDPKKLDEAILDQQIRENIFHLQNPEDKLSEKYKKKTVEFNSAKEVDKVIEKFIQQEPQIQPPKAENINTENMARKSSEDQLSIVTETLANIYVGQGMYEKAISVFVKLIAENPEKKSYFATRIKELEQKL